MARSLDDVMAAIRERDDHHLYASLAPLYAFIYDRHFDYDAQFDVVEEVVPDGTTSVLEVGCGAGQLLGHLDDAYDRVVGVEMNEEMAALAAEAAPTADVVTADMATADLGERFDAVVMLGRVLPHALTDEEGGELLRNCYAHLRPGGVLAFDTFDARGLEAGDVREGTFESPAYSVTRTMEKFVTDAEAGRWGFTAEYAITDRETGETVVTEETMNLRAHTPAELESYVEAVGGDLSLTRESDFSLRAVASKPDG